MRVFADLHHAGLYYSLSKLFEERLGWELYRPIGTEWFEKGFWDIAKPYGNNIATVKQFLSIKDGDVVVPFSHPLNRILEGQNEAKCYKIADIYHNSEEKALTFQQFCDMEIDIIVASIPDHWVTYKRLRDEYKPHAKVICQMGNMFDEVQPMIGSGVVQNLMASTSGFPTGNINKVFYHQEQPVRDFKKPTKTFNISSYAHVLPLPEQFDMYKQMLPDFNWKSYGASSYDGWMGSLNDLYDSMQNDMFVYHVKPGGDGYGWNWHSAYMLGRPVLTNFSDYRGKLGSLLFEDGVTGHDFEAHSVEENCRLLREYAKKDFITMGENARKRWLDVVNYDLEFEKLQEFLGNLQ